MAIAQKHTVISISGFLEWKSHTDPDNSTYSAIHHEYNEELKPLIKDRFRFNHGVSKKKLRKALDEIGCKKETGTELIIIGNSWGSRKAHLLSEMYQEKCGEEIELFIQIDGVAKPIGPQKRIPVAKNCINYYQRVTPIIRGKSIEGCKNRSFNSECTVENKMTFENCHMYICREAAKLAQTDIYNHITKNSTDWYENNISLNEGGTCH